MNKMNVELVKKIDSFLNKHDGLRGQPATDTEIKEAENILNIKFNDEYIEFIKLFGGSFCGIDIYAFKNGSLIGKETVTDTTLSFRKNNPFYQKDEGILKNYYVLSYDGGEGLFLMNVKGEIMLYYLDSGSMDFLYHSLNELLIKTFY